MYHILLTALAAASAPATPIGYTNFNNVEVMLYKEKGSCKDGALAKVTTKGETKDSCWAVDGEGDYIVLDLGSIIIGIPYIQFTIINLKPYS
jgi:hypothetical protein